MQPLLKIDLSDDSIHQIDVPEIWCRQFLGGASLAARLLYQELTPALDPLGTDAPLLFMTGPLTGTSGPAVAAALQAKGFEVGPGLRYLWITSPTYLQVDNNGQMVRYTTAGHVLSALLCIVLWPAAPASSGCSSNRR